MGSCLNSRVEDVVMKKSLSCYISLDYNPMTIVITVTHNDSLTGRLVSNIHTTLHFLHLLQQKNPPKWQWMEPQECERTDKTSVSRWSDLTLCTLASGTESAAATFTGSSTIPTYWSRLAVAELVLSGLDMKRKKKKVVSWSWRRENKIDGWREWERGGNMLFRGQDHKDWKMKRPDVLL